MWCRTMFTYHTENDPKKQIVGHIHCWHSGSPELTIDDSVRGSIKFQKTSEELMNFAHEKIAKYGAPTGEKEEELNNIRYTARNYLFEGTYVSCGAQQDSSSPEKILLILGNYSEDVKATASRLGLTLEKIIQYPK